jgi:hypothetical protein
MFGYPKDEMNSIMVEIFPKLRTFSSPLGKRHIRGMFLVFLYRLVQGVTFLVTAQVFSRWGVSPSTASDYWQHILVAFSSAIATLEVINRPLEDYWLDLPDFKFQGVDRMKLTAQHFGSRTRACMSWKIRRLLGSTNTMIGNLN